MKLFTMHIYSEEGKSGTLTKSHSSITKIGKVETDTEILYRKLFPTEAEKLQTVPYNYTEGVSKSARYKMLGNGWTVDVIVHIFSFLSDSHKNKF